MLNSRLSHLHDLIRQHSARVGNNAPRIADAIIRDAFPETYDSAEREGAEKILRMGLIDFIKPLLRSVADVDGQSDFAEHESTFGHITSQLKKETYYVPSIEEYVSINALIAEPDMLNEARRHMRQKGEECLAEAKVLDELFEAVTA